MRLIRLIGYALVCGVVACRGTETLNSTNPNQTASNPLIIGDWGVQGQLHQQAVADQNVGVNGFADAKKAHQINHLCGLAIDVDDVCVSADRFIRVGTNANIVL
ncbi:hypothetical protein [Spirosoma aerolatum]|uniref:hypothetical protein n=1 Tax=Spirosoma aerolatum TaxID=1211326 RepID=UPI0009AE805E|nr:hypothetical protein [Spirosoma aerolatum]